MLARNFKSWRFLVAETLTYRLKNQLVDAKNAKMIKRRVFDGWKSVTIFLELPAHSVMYYCKLEMTAYVCRKKRVFDAWVKIARIEREMFAKMGSETVPRQRLARFWLYWRASCEFQWRNRGNLIMRFFRLLRYALLYALLLVLTTLSLYMVINGVLISL